MLKFVVAYGDRAFEQLPRGQVYLYILDSVLVVAVESAFILIFMRLTCQTVTTIQMIPTPQPSPSAPVPPQSLGRVSLEM